VLVDVLCVELTGSGRRGGMSSITSPEDSRVRCGVKAAPPLLKRRFARFRSPDEMLTRDTLRLRRGGYAIPPKLDTEPGTHILPARLTRCQARAGITTHVRRSERPEGSSESARHEESNVNLRETLLRGFAG